MCYKRLWFGWKATGADARWPHWQPRLSSRPSGTLSQNSLAHLGRFLQATEHLQQRAGLSAAASIVERVKLP